MAKMMMKSMAKAMKASMKMKKSMKAMVMKKAMKKRAMKKTAKSYKTSSGAKRAVFKGIISKTKGGLAASTLMKNKHGKIVSKKQSAAASKKLGKWLKAVAAARKALGIKGMVPVGGKSAKGAALYKKAKSLYK